MGGLMRVKLVVHFRETQVFAKTLVNPSYVPARDDTMWFCDDAFSGDVKHRSINDDGSANVKVHLTMSSDEYHETLMKHLRDHEWLEESR